MEYSFLRQLLESDQGFDSVLSKIKKDCAPFLSQREGNFLYRGMKIPRTGGDWLRKIDKNFYIIATQVNRKPVDSSSELHNALNTVMAERTGIPVRSNCVFVAGNQFFAEDYGSIKLIFPIGEFHFAWSPNVIDAFTDLHVKVADAISGIRLILDTVYDEYDHSKKVNLLSLDSNSYAKLVIDTSQDEIKKSSRSIGDLHFASAILEQFIETNPSKFKAFFDEAVELTPLDKRYMLAHKLTSDIGKFLLLSSSAEFFQSCIVQYIKKFANYEFDEHLSDAAESGNEVMIVCDKYYAVDYGSNLAKFLMDNL